MGTRALIHFKGHAYSPDVIAATIYVQFDGYPTGLGAKIKEVFAGHVMRNGFSGKGREVNGPGCAAATFVAAAKRGTGNIYIYRPGESDVGEEYVYTIDGKVDEPLTLKVESGQKILYQGPVDTFDPEAAEAIEEDDA